MVQIPTSFLRVEPNTSFKRAKKDIQCPIYTENSYNFQAHNAETIASTPVQIRWYGNFWGGRPFDHRFNRLILTALVTKLSKVLICRLNERLSKWFGCAAIIIEIRLFVRFSAFYIYRIVASSRPVYYSILNSFGQKSQYISIKFPLKTVWKCFGVLLTKKFYCSWLYGI